MRELHGVISLATTDYKPYMLLFDKLHVFGLERYRLNNETAPDVDRISAEFDFLQDNGLIEPLPLKLTEQIPPEIHGEIARLASADPLVVSRIRDVLIRSLADILPVPASDVVPICETQLPELIPAPKPRSHSGVVLSVALDAIPVPDETCAWEDIMAFKSEMHDKLWGFRRFLHTLSEKQQTEAQIRDDIEWSLNQYTKEMDRFKLKRSVSFMEAYVIPAVEILEDFKPSSFLKARVAIKKRKIELLEAEDNGPGRECAYVFDAQKRFSK